MMREGMYLLKFAGTRDWGAGVLILDNGLVYGADVGGASYDGTYKYDTQIAKIRTKIKVRIPPGVATVQGTSFPYEVAFDVEVTFPRETEKAQFQINTPIGPVTVEIQFLRRIPEAA